MSLKSFDTLLTAWLLVPVVVAIVSAGLGSGLRLLSGLELGALTLPAGYLAGMVLMSFAVEAGLSGKAATVLCIAAAAVGPVALLVRRRRWRPDGWHLWAAAAGLAAYSIGIAPVVGSGHVGVLGYVLNNDPAFHNVLVQRLIDAGATSITPFASSFDVATGAFDQGYPVGAYVWPMLAGVVTGSEAFEIWSPLVAVTVAMTAITAFHLLRRLGGSPWVCAIAGATVAVSYLPFSYLAQGGAKEVALPLALLVTVALLAEPLDGRLTWRALLPAGVAAAASIADFGYVSLAFVGPALLAFVVVLVLRARRQRDWGVLRPLVPFAVLALAAAAPSAAASIEFIREGSSEFKQQAEIGNLLSDLPLREMLGVWFSGDYRFDLPEWQGLTMVGSLLVAALVVVGLVFVVRRRNFALPVAAAAALVGSLAITPSVSIYFDAKTYLVIAPMVALLAAAGVVMLSLQPGLRERIEAGVFGILLVAGVLVSAGFVYTDSWVTPRERFEELRQIAAEIREPGPLLMSEREEYGMFFLREEQAWGDWGERPVLREFNTKDGLPKGLPHTPDFDDYTLAHVERFPLLLQRRRPGGSLPPQNYVPALETKRYRLWRREGATPRAHLPLGADSLSGAEELDCDDRDVRQFMRAAAGGDVDVALPGSSPQVVVEPGDWQVTDEGRVLPPPDQIVLRRGFASGSATLPPGRWRAWLQGSIGGLARLRVANTNVADVFADLGLPDAWQPMGIVESDGRPLRFELSLMDRNKWFAGDRHASLLGPLVVEPENSQPRIERMPAERVRELCDKQVDWLEIPG